MRRILTLNPLFWLTIQQIIQQASALNREEYLAIREVLQANNTTELDLTNRSVINSNLSYIMGALRDNTSVVRLILSGNFITNSGLQTILAILPSEFNLTQIIIEDNCCVLNPELLAQMEALLERNRLLVTTTQQLTTTSTTRQLTATSTTRQPTTTSTTSQAAPPAPPPPAPTSQNPTDTPPPAPTSQDATDTPPPAPTSQDATDTPRPAPTSKNPTDTPPPAPTPQDVTDTPPPIPTAQNPTGTPPPALTSQSFATPTEGVAQTPTDSATEPDHPELPLPSTPDANIPPWQANGNFSNTSTYYAPSTSTTTRPAPLLTGAQSTTNAYNAALLGGLVGLAVFLILILIVYGYKRYQNRTPADPFAQNTATRAPLGGYPTPVAANALYEEPAANHHYYSEPGTGEGNIPQNGLYEEPVDPQNYSAPGAGEGNIPQNGLYEEPVAAGAQEGYAVFNDLANTLDGWDPDDYAVGPQPPPATSQSPYHYAGPSSSPKDPSYDQASQGSGPLQYAVVGRGGNSPEKVFNGVETEDGYAQPNSVLQNSNV